MSRRGPHRIITIDRDKFATTAIEVGANDCAIPDSKYVVPLTGGEPIVEQPKAPVVEVVEAPVPAPDLMQDPIARLRDAVRELQAAMRDVNYVEMVITEREVKFKQVQVVEGSFTL